MTDLATQFSHSPYQSYAYAYPHKTAYRPFEEPIPLHDLWQPENRDSLFLYLHIPFCEMRCGFCNLFTTVNPEQDYDDLYIAALTRQIERVRMALGNATFSRLAIGGGTPTYLEADNLETVFQLLIDNFELDLRQLPTSIETSPLTATPERLQVLQDSHVDRISIGVQSFIEEEARAAGRPQRTADVLNALNCIRTFNFQTLNIDLIYGLPGQTVDSWRYSLQQAMVFEPEELYLYPLYVRPLTGLDRLDHEWDDDRLACYRTGRTSYSIWAMNRSRCGCSAAHLAKTPMSRSIAVRKTEWLDWAVAHGLIPPTFIIRVITPSRISM